MLSQRRTQETIDEIVARDELACKARASQEKLRRIELSKKLGDRAAQGEPFGIQGFMAIGFPNLTSESEEYQTLVRACFAVRRIATGSCAKIGAKFTGAIGIKADAADKGLAFRVQREASGAYYAYAEILCTRALWTHHAASRATMHGSEEDPYPVHFIESYLGRAIVKPVCEIILADSATESRDQYADGKYSFTDAYTQRLTAQPVTC